MPLPDPRSCSRPPSGSHSFPVPPSPHWESGPSMLAVFRFACLLKCSRWGERTGTQTSLITEQVQGEKRMQFKVGVEVQALARWRGGELWGGGNPCGSLGRSGFGRGDLGFLTETCTVGCQPRPISRVHKDREGSTPRQGTQKQAKLSARHSPEFSTVSSFHAAQGKMPLCGSIQDGKSDL